MRKLLLAVVGVLLIGTSARAALILNVEDVIVNQSLSGPTTGFFEVSLEETGGTEALVHSYNIGLRLAPVGVVTFTGASASVDHPSLFLGQSPTNRTSLVTGYVPGNDILLTDDFVVSGQSTNAPVQNGVRDGLFRVAFSVPEAATGVFTVNVDPSQFEIADAEANAYSVVINNGSITVVPVPEPAALGLALLALPLALRRKR